MNPKNKLIILADGQGTLFSHIVKSCHSTAFPALEQELSQTFIHKKVLALLTSNPKAPVIQVARRAKVPVKILPPQKFPSMVEWDQAMCHYFRQTFLNEKSTNWIVLAGFLKKIGPHTLSVFKNRIINIHPSLLPRHGGAGLYGLHVHRSVIKAGDKKTGISIHLVSEEYDQGPLLAQMKIPVSSKDTPESLQKKVKAHEKDFYMNTLNKIFQNQLKGGPIKT